MQWRRWSRAHENAGPTVRDVTLAASLLMLGLAEATWATGGQRLMSLTLVVALTVPLAWRTSQPEAVALTVTAALVVQQLWPDLRLFDQTFTGFVCVLLGFYALGRHGSGPWALPALAACALAVAVALGTYDRSVATFVLGVVFAVTPFGTGRVVAARLELRDLLDRQADMLRTSSEIAERTRVAEVRGRIAGEVQELVSRRVHDMVDRARTARRLAQDDRGRAGQLVAAVEADGRSALEEMRAMLGALRSADLPSTSSLDGREGPPRAVSRAGQLTLWRLELPLVTAFVVLLLGESLASPGALPTASLTALAPLVTFMTGARTARRAALAGLALALAVVTLVNLLVIRGGWGDYVFPSVLIGLSWLGGRLVREQNVLVERSRCRAVALERSAEVRAVAAATEERLRLARELHDVLAHTLMVMVVQAGAARRILEKGRAGAADALRVVEETGGAATSELRRLLTLVDPDAGLLTAEHDGTPGLGDLRSLVERARAAGLAAELVVEGRPAQVPSGLGLAAYRVAQEAVTNVIRHAHARHVRLRVHYTPERVHLEVRDDGRSLRDAQTITAGNGITGMRERVGIYHGMLHAGPAPDHDGFVVEASLPLVPVRQEQPA